MYVRQGAEEGNAVISAAEEGFKASGDDFDRVEGGAGSAVSIGSRGSCRLGGVREGTKELASCMLTGAGGGGGGRGGA